ncbi:DNA-processing protein DprA [[Flexibacter] sp. ATCC 35208]|uniref:DNA-processing protein DprA n=1 Tax=[Flexibacter] sp. ATCC 35208 TaxID=1936242 RepID=UPI0009CFF158|nr:DNA-processing protein DprA [[Flexibacter] sp. ATCC 35208]OMP80111.1 hypothetical protein BW716_06355 [[Flexibacter] sp. ATCC 35208]
MRDKVLDILFLTYLTGYVIEDIFEGLQYDDPDSFVEDYMRRRQDSGRSVPKVNLQELWQRTRECYEEMKFRNISFIPYGGSNYPASITTIQPAPPLLFLRGWLKTDKNVAIIGTRQVTAHAPKAVEHAVHVFGEQGYGIVSGLAYGIDSLAHETALKNDIYTLAILPNSLDYIYPKDHLPLANKILDAGGGLLSELAIGINLGKRGFVQRNRLQSAISDFVMPVEMGLHSGTMHTVNFCKRQHKQLLVVRPQNDTIGLVAYEGIRTLIGDQYPYLTVLESNYSFNDICPPLSAMPVNEMFSKTRPDLKKHGDDPKENPLMDQFTTELQLLADKMLKEFKVQLPHVRTDTQLRQKRVATLKLALQQFQKLTFRFLEKYPSLPRKDLEKCVSAVQKETKATIFSAEAGQA